MLECHCGPFQRIWPCCNHNFVLLLFLWIPWVLTGITPSECPFTAKTSPVKKPTDCKQGDREGVSGEKRNDGFVCLMATALSFARTSYTPSPLSMNFHYKNTWFKWRQTSWFQRIMKEISLFTTFFSFLLFNQNEDFFQYNFLWTNINYLPCTLSCMLSSNP